MNKSFYKEQPLSSIELPRREIPTLLERKGSTIYAFAYCPICDKAEKSSDGGRGQAHALNASVARIRAHMRLEHRVS